jgi:hypothetical protein
MPAACPDCPLTTERRATIVQAMAKAQTNGRPEPLSPERLAELRVPAVYKTPEEKREALKRATEGLRVKVRVTRDMYRPR